MHLSISSVLKYPQVYELDFIIRSYEVDFRGNLNPVVLCSMLQEIASSHASSVSADITDLMKDNRTWMLSRLYVKIKRYPKWKDKIRIFTWPVGIHRLFAVRDFFIANEDGEIIAVSTSSWLVIDFKRRKPVRVDEYLKRMYLLPDIRAINQLLDKPSFQSVELKEIGRDSVKLKDIDINGHMTSMKYIEKVIDSFDEEIQKKSVLTDILIYYNYEALLNDGLIIKTGADDLSCSYLHKIIRDKDNQELCVLKTEWSRVK